jgi:hypothetical protein
MKTIIFIIGLLAGLVEPALAQTNEPASPSAAPNAVPLGALVTKQGTIYYKFYVERADPGGVTISYVPAGGGLGMERVSLGVLPDDWQRRYEYDPEKAAKFDLEQKKATAQLREQMIAEENAYREKRAQEEAAEEAAKKAAEEASAAQATNALAITNVPEITIAPTIAPAITNAPAIIETNQPPPKPPVGS